MAKNHILRKIPDWGTPEWCQFVKRNHEAFNALPYDTFTNDGLIKCTDMIQVFDQYSYTLWLRNDNSISIAPNEYSSPVLGYLSERKELWDLAAIRVVSGRGIYSRAPMFGMPFQKALIIALKQGFMKAEFYLPTQKDDGFYATLLFHINKRKDSNGATIELQVWQYCPGLSEVFYIHAESSDFSDYVTHLDGAVIHFHPDDIIQLFKFCEKIKGDQYEKQFRLDGTIPISDMLNIVSDYLPVKELVDEAFQIRTA